MATLRKFDIKLVNMKRERKVEEKTVTSVAPVHPTSRPEGPFPEELAELKSTVNHLVSDPQTLVCNGEKILALSTSRCHGDY